MPVAPHPTPVAPQWCKSLNRSESTHRLQGIARSFNRVFHNFCGKTSGPGSPPPADGDAGSRITRRRPGVRPAVTVKLQGSSHLGTLRHGERGGSGRYRHRAGSRSKKRRAMDPGVRLGTGNQQSACGFLARPQAHVSTRGRPERNFLPDAVCIRAATKIQGRCPCHGRLRLGLGALPPDAAEVDERAVVGGDPGADLVGETATSCRSGPRRRMPTPSRVIGAASQWCEK